MVIFLPALYFPLNFGSPLLSGLFFFRTAAVYRVRPGAMLPDPPPAHPPPAPPPVQVLVAAT